MAKKHRFVDQFAKDWDAETFEKVLNAAEEDGGVLPRMDSDDPQEREDAEWIENMRRALRQPKN